jgi:integrase
MSRPKSDGTKASAPNKRVLTELYVKKVKPQAVPFNAWDTTTRGLVLRVHPTGKRVFKYVYSFRASPRWYHIGDADKIGLTDAKRIAAKVHLDKCEGKDPVAERKAANVGTFRDLAQRYFDDYAMKETKTWQTAKRIVDNHLKRWANLDAAKITRDDVRNLKKKFAATPIMANRVIAVASAIFQWAITEDLHAGDNPCRGVKLFEEKARERVLSDSELPQFWKGFDSAGLIRGSALKVILLTGQRPGEVAHMRREHIRDGWWEMPGEPVPALGWGGLKNGQSHRVWLTEAVRAILAELDEEASTGFVFAAARGGPVADLPNAMAAICKKLSAERATPHDLRRTFSTAVTRLGFGRDAMNRVTNHREGGIADVYDRHRYEAENQKVMEAVAAHIMALAEGRPAANVVPLRSAWA